LTRRPQPVYRARHQLRMNQHPHRPNSDGLDATREAMRRDLHRANTAVGVILIVVLALAVAAVIAGMRAAKSFARAEQAEAASRERLWNSYVAQARAVRLTPQAGRRDAVLNVISNATAIRRNASLRSEAIATLALTDIETVSPLQPIPRGTDQVEIDASLERFAYGNSTGTVFVCSMKDGSVLHTLTAQELGPGTQQGVRSVAFSPDGSKLAARFAGGAMVIWETATQKQLVTSGVTATNLVIAGMSFWPDANKISFGDADAQGQITVFDFDTNTRVNTALRIGAKTFRFRPGTRQVAVATDNRVDLFNYPEETPLQTLETATRIFILAWSPDGSRLVVATEDGDLYVWDMLRGNQRIFRGHSEPCTRLTFSPDGELLASGSRDGTTRLWDVAQGQTIVIATEGLAHVFSPDGERIGYWKPSAGFGVWRLARSDAYKLLVCPKSEGAFLSVDLSPNGRWCVATQSKGVRLWDLANGAKEFYFPGADMLSARIMPDESGLYICRRQQLEYWPIQTNATGVQVDLGATQTVALPDNQSARGIALSLDGKKAVVELTDLSFVVLDLTKSTPPVMLEARSRQISLRTPGSPTGAGRFTISPDGKWVVTGFGVGATDQPKVWDATTGKLVTTLNFGSAVVTFDPEGRRLGAAGPAAFAIWDTANWELLHRFDRDEPAITHGSMAFMQGNDEIAVTRTRQIAQLRHALTNDAYTDLIAPQLQSVNSVRMSRDGGVVVTASATDKLQVWHLDALRTKLAPVNLDWRAPQPNSPDIPSAKPESISPVQTTLLLSLVGFALAALFAMATLRRHREAISGYLAAETRAAGRNRELEVAKVELMHSQKMQALGTLATGIAHDFNNLLSVIRMSNKLIGRETKNHPEIQENVADIEQAVMQGKNVVGSMLGYARTEDESAGPTDVSAVVEDTVSLLSKEFLSGIALTLELDREAPQVSVGRGRLEQVLLNLVVNASEAMQGKGKLKITLQPRPTLPAKTYALRPNPAAQYLELSVVDSGPGIAPEVQPRLFEPFFTTKRAGAKAGTGLGLSLVFTIAQQDGLGLSVESEPNRGATFTIVIPILNSGF
jgi:signal transduction histidine kinase